MMNRTTPTRALAVRAGATLPIGIDFAAYLADAETVDGNGAPTARLTDMADGSPTTGMLSAPPAVKGAVVEQTVTGLRAGHRYRLEVVIRPAAGKVWAAELELESLCAHVLADRHSVEVLCPPAKARRQRVAAGLAD